MRRWLPPWRRGAELAPCSECGTRVVASTRDGFGRCAQCHERAVRRGRGEDGPLERVLERARATEAKIAELLTPEALEHIRRRELEAEAELLGAPLPLWEDEAHG
jgi:tRNA(Ile2) C34 agmatinyltransferase TiaS